VLGENITINAVCPGLVDTPLLVGPIRDALKESGFPMIDPAAVAEAVYGCVMGDATGQAIVVQAGLDPTPYRFARPPGPREEGAIGKLPPEWIADPGTPRPS
jgi:NAD(P)-dependent dehydrogenase (short-subunit alcohol dehydrogenase family)